VKKKDNTRKKESQINDYVIIRYYNGNGNTFDIDMRKKMCCIAQFFTNSSAILKRQEQKNALFIKIRHV